MTELPNDYLNTLASHFILICSFVVGFSATLLGTLIVADQQTKYSRAMIAVAALSAACFVVALLGMTGIVLITKEGYPLPIGRDKLYFMRTVCSIVLLVLASLCPVGLFPNV